MRNTVFCTLSVIVFVLAACQAKAVVDNKTVYVHTVEDFADVREPGA